MSKKKTWIVILIIAAFFLVLCIAVGMAVFCWMIDHSVSLDRSVKMDKKIIAAELERKYGEEFTVVWYKYDGGNGGGSCVPSRSERRMYTALCMRKTDSNLYFKTDMWLPNGIGSWDDKVDIYNDTFIQTLVARKIENKLRSELLRYGNDFALNVSNNREFDTGITSAGDTTIENFSAALQKKKNDSPGWWENGSDIDIDVVFPEDTDFENDILLSVMDSMTELFYSMHVTVGFYYTDEERYNDCLKLEADRKNLYGWKLFGRVSDKIREDEVDVTSFYYDPDEGLVQTWIHGEPIFSKEEPT